MALSWLKSPSCRRLRAWPEVGGERRIKQTPSPAERPSAASSGLGPKSAARGGKRGV